MTPLEKARRDLLEGDFSTGSYYNRVVKPTRLRAKVATYENADDFGFTVSERSKLYKANLEMAKAGIDANILYRPANHLNSEEMRALYQNYQTLGFSRKEIFSLIPGIEADITGYTEVWDKR